MFGECWTATVVNKMHWARSPEWTAAAAAVFAAAVLFFVWTLVEPYRTLVWGSCTLSEPYAIYPYPGSSEPRPFPKTFKLTCPLDIED